ncbi:hypothetical protein [Microbacterium allomyrinae]|uniref:DUF3558 domain-containing protein n=1 Tax=Microbacterium allomyrinae TaxID=2830666 RepID=A0A9X1LWQ9_9MICO|nr:hypothetical protein [Microbacterium allomyrinae]MCC2033226.1 hypothetical protein [Microbacterium allomyrinae]
MRRRTPVAALTGAVLLLAGCAIAPQGAPGSVAGSASATPQYACPEQPGVELPPECAPYDPDAAMAQNDVYRERFEMDAADQAANADLAAAVATALQGLDRSALTEESVTSAITDAGVEGSVQLHGDARAYAFGAAVAGGCVFGQVDQTAVSVELGGFIRDGGCLPAQ